MMNKSIGIRVTSDTIYYAVVKERADQNEVIIVDKIRSPKAMDFPDKLKIIRTNILDIINENKINHACIRIAEYNSRNVSRERIGLEAVIQESLASSSIDKYQVVVLRQIASILNIATKELKDFSEKGGSLSYVVDMNNKIKEEKEAILAAFCGLQL